MSSRVSNIKIRLMKFNASNKKLSFESTSNDNYGSHLTRLPKINLPHFSGIIQDWPFFWAQFENYVHKTNLPSITKFSYLLSVLEHEAKTTICSLSITPDNYQKAIDLLIERYGNDRKIIYSHINDLLQLSCPSSPDISLLWSFHDSLQGHISSLEFLKVTGEQYGLILTPLILSRLPVDLRMEWARNGDGHEDDLKYLMKFLKFEIQRRERSIPEINYGRHSFSSVTSLHVKDGYRSRNPRPSSNNNSNIRCAFCNRNHGIASCDELLSIDPAERLEKLKMKRLCIKCLLHGPSNRHNFNECKGKCSKCKGSHHKILCDAFKPNPDDSNNKHVSSTLSSFGPKHSNVLLQTLNINVKGREKSRQAVVLFDTGADRSYISQALVNDIKPEWIDSTFLSYSAFGSNQPSNSERREIYHISLQGKDNIITVNTICVPSICAPVTQPIIPTELISSLPNLVSIPIGGNLNIDMLIGLDMYWKIMYGEVKYLTPDLVMQNSKLRWVLSGNVPIDKDMSNSHNRVSTGLFCKTDMEQFWSLETIGITDNEDMVKDPILNDFTENIERLDDRYTVALPWKPNMRHKLVSNRANALKRLKSLDNRLNKSETLKTQYNDFFKNMFNQGIIEDVDPKTPIEGPIFYLPHHPVVKEHSSTTKVRPVFDASAKGYNNISLNDCMEAGPNFLPDLPAVLIRFRRWKIALTADITKAFLQVGVHVNDRDVHRFLWNDDGNIRDMRFTRVPFGNKGSPFLLMATIKHHLSTLTPSKAVNELFENLYMDDLVSGCDTEKDAVSIFNDAQSIMNEAGMVLTKWGSNCDNLYQYFGKDGINDSSCSVLGMKWSPTNDNFSFVGPKAPIDICITKRVLLSTISRVFDPLGLLAPFVIKAKVLFQSVWRIHTDWDEILCDDIANVFRNWLNEFDILKKWSVPRRFTTELWSDNPSIVVHGFGDASEHAYGACVYLMIRNAGKIDTSLVMSRARVAPIKSVSLPRLELLAALLCARLVTYVCKSLKLPTNQEVHCWTDSTITLAWLQKEPTHWKTFVANRVASIRELVNPNRWHHCPGEFNPADLLTRGISGKDLIASKLWLEGPVDIMLKDFADLTNEHETVEEIRRHETTLTAVTSTDYVPIIDVKRHSSWLKVLRVTAFVLRFISIIRKRSKIKKEVLTLDELSEAKVFLIRETQLVYFRDDIVRLKAGNFVSKNSSIFKLSPFLSDDGLLRVRGRIQLANLPSTTQHPIIIPKCYLASLLTKHTHIQLKHAGVNSMLVNMRDNYWIVSARRICKDIKKRCTVCQRFDARPFSQPMAPLPKERVTPKPPFTVTGIDHGGTLFCVDFPGKKFYILLFTCAVTRAIHLELVDSKSQKDTVLALRRFFARRGRSSIIWSDNDKGFVASNNYLKDCFGEDCPEWKFIVPRAPWWGGWWERLIRSVKTSLRKSVGRSLLTRTELETVIHEVESCINSRPLTFVSSDLDSNTILTPSHFLLGRASPITKVQFSEENIFSEFDNKIQLSLLDSHLGVLGKQFWDIWRDEYLRNLNPFIGNKNHNDIKIGLVVLIEDEGPKLTWPLGVIEEIFIGKDNIIRSVKLRTAQGHLIRPIQKLRNLEVS